MEKKYIFGFVILTVLILLFVLAFSYLLIGLEFIKSMDFIYSNEIGTGLQILIMLILLFYVFQSKNKIRKEELLVKLKLKLKDFYFFVFFLIGIIYLGLLPALFKVSNQFVLFLIFVYMYCILHKTIKSLRT